MSEYKVSEEIRDIFDESLVAKECRDKCINSIFKARRAIFYGKQYVQLTRKAWKLARELYPELDGKALRYDYNTGIVSIDEG